MRCKNCSIELLPAFTDIIQIDPKEPERIKRYITCKCRYTNIIYYKIGIVIAANLYNGSEKTNE
jgi:hypothetical protein